VSLVLPQLDTYSKEVKHYKQINSYLLFCCGDFYFLNLLFLLNFISAGSWADVFEVASCRTLYHRHISLELFLNWRESS
jgi:hypothetical protein